MYKHLTQFLEDGSHHGMTVEQKTEHDTHSPWARSTLAARDLMLAGKLALAGRFFCRVERSVWAFLRLLATLRRLREFESNWEPLPSTGPVARTESKMAFQYELGLSFSIRVINWRSSSFLIATDWNIQSKCWQKVFWFLVSNRKKTEKIYSHIHILASFPGFCAGKEKRG